jgi:two-component system, cell cycle response regulator DivK
MGNYSGNTILVAEDCDDSRQMLRTFLESRGYQVAEARNGKEAVAVARRAKPDLILMDLNMPELDGISAAKVIRDSADLSAVPILATSADGGRGIELFMNIKNFGRGYIEYVTKPLNLDALAELIENALPNVSKAA